ncbi:MAG: TonB-dependent receptor, partial [Tunicatimonas sp.]|uniref:TonB-dependent receptor n=1 Tax=Tunicatimonas sp. TaxID=1940096 RepID=UPI003C78B1B5
MRSLKLLTNYRILILSLLLSGSVYSSLIAQVKLEETIQMDSSQYKVYQLLDQLKVRQGWRVAYSENYLNVNQVVSLPQSELTLRELLHAIAQATGTAYHLRENQIIFQKKNAKFTISGYIRNASSGEDLIGASIWRCNSSTSDSSLAPMLGMSSNKYGFYSLTLPAADSVRLRCSYVGHNSQVATIALHQDTIINWNLSNAMLAEVMVTSSSTQPIAPLSPDLPVAPRFLLATPMLLGEVDVLKGLQRLPGVQAGVDGSADLFVRGSSPDQNLMLLDGVPVYNATHLFGFFSIFNADAINYVDFYKGHFPARYGGRLASVVDMQLKEGNREKFQGTGKIGLLSTRLTLEGPIFSEKTSFLVSGRYGHPGIITRLLANDQDGIGNLYYGFHDLTAKINHTFSHRDQLYLSVYSGRNRLSEAGNFETTFESTDETRTVVSDGDTWWGNFTTALRWNHIFNQRIFSNLTLTRSRYHYRGDESERIETSQGGDDPLVNEYDRKRISSIRDWAAKLDFDFLPNPRHHLRFGSSVTLHGFQPNSVDLVQRIDEQILIDTTYGTRTVYGTEVDIYVEDEVQLASSLTANVGFRMSAFLLDDVTFFRGQPRLSLRYRPSSLASAWVSYSRMAQFLHLSTYPLMNLPTDQWLPSNRELPPETAHQWGVGYRRQLGNYYRIQAEG